MDKLDKLFQMQSQLDGFIASSRNLNFTKEEWIQKRSLALMNEVSELLCEVNYKWWKNPKPVDEEKVKEEMVDILHFFLGMCIDAGLSSEEMFKIYMDKNQENYDRQIGKSLKTGYELDKT